MKLIKRFLAVTMATLCAATMAVSAYAAEEWIDLNAKGSVTVTMKDTEDKTIAGGEVTIYKVANIAEDDGDLSYSYTNYFEDCGIELGDLEKSDLAEQLSAKINGSAVYVTQTVGDDGETTFQDLSLGLYLVKQTKAASGYNVIEPFLVSVPTYEDDVFTYNVDAYPKMGKATKKPSDSSSHKSSSSTTTAEKTSVVNPTPVNIRQTGQLNWPIPVLTVSGIVLIGFGVVFWKKKSAEDCKNPKNR